MDKIFRVFALCVTICVVCIFFIAHQRAQQDAQRDVALPFLSLRPSVCSSRSAIVSKRRHISRPLQNSKRNPLMSAYGRDVYRSSNGCSAVELQKDQILFVVITKLFLYHSHPIATFAASDSASNVDNVRLFVLSLLFFAHQHKAAGVKTKQNVKQWLQRLLIRCSLC